MEGEAKLLMDARVQIISNFFKLRHFAVRHRLIYCIFTSALLMWDFLNTLLRNTFHKTITKKFDTTDSSPLITIDKCDPKFLLLTLIFSIDILSVDNSLVYTYK